MIGKVYLVKNHWWIEDAETGAQMAVRSGEPGIFHPYLARGRDENRTVQYRKDHDKAVITLNPSRK